MEGGRKLVNLRSSIFSSIAAERHFICIRIHVCTVLSQHFHPDVEVHLIIGERLFMK